MRRAGWALFVAMTLLRRPASADEPTDASAPAHPPPSRPPRIAYRISGGADYRRIDDISVAAGHVGVGLGFEFDKPIAIYISGDFVDGTRGYGLGVLFWRAGVDIEGRFGRLRPTFGVGSGVLSMARATEGPSVGFTSGVRIGLSFDFLRWAMRDEDPYLDVAAAFINAQFHVDVAGDAAAALWGPSVGLGVRL